MSKDEYCSISASAPNGFDLSGRGIHDRDLLYPVLAT